MTAQKISPDAPLETVWKGAGWFNVYFFAKFALAYFGYLNLEPAYNALLFAAVVLPIGTRAFDLLRNVVCALAAAALLWHESWLPGPEAIRANAHNLTDFSASFLFDFVVNAVNPVIVAWLAAGIVAWLFLRRWIRFSTLTVIGLVVTAFPQLVTWALPGEKEAPAQEVAAATETAALPQSEAPAGPLRPPQPANGTGDDIDRWLTAFLTEEENRVVSLPSEPVPESVSGAFDIAIVNVCSLSHDDLAATGLERHGVWSKFDVNFTGFSSATSYSGPATLRLLTAACGQPPHSALYGERRPQCELLNRFAAAGWENRLYLDHNGRFDNYLASLRELAGLTPALNDLTKLHVRYEAFDGSPVYDDADVFNQWFSDLCARPASRTVSLFNLVALHDGNRAPGSAKSFDYAPLAKSLLDDLEGIMNRIEKSGRPVLFIVVPEHGAAVRGDKIQMARLREIPSPKITNVPVLVKFFGLKLDGTLRTIEAPTSYLALAELMARTATSGVYRDREADASAAVDAILMDLPQTWPVSQNANASVVRFAGVHWVRLHAGKWIKYPE